MVIEAEAKHPRVIKDGIYIKQSCCCINVGCFGCCQNYLKSDIDTYGLGFSVYFKSLKSLMYALLLIILINALLYYIYYTNHPENPIYTYGDALFKLSIGNIAACNINLINFSLEQLYKSSNNSLCKFTIYLQFWLQQVRVCKGWKFRT